MKPFLRLFVAVVLAGVAPGWEGRIAAATVSIDVLSRAVAVGVSSRTGSGDSLAPVLSGNGRFVAFVSDAADLVTNSIARGPGQAYVNVFVRDLAAGTTELISVSADGHGSGQGHSVNPLISSDGRFVVFESDAGDLVDADTNGARDVFVRDRVSGTTTLVSAAGVGPGAGNGASSQAVMTPDGRFVAFVSTAANLVPNDTNGIPDVFLRDLSLGTTTLISEGAVAGANAFATSRNPSIGDDGKVVAFSSTATGLLAEVSDATGHVYVRDVASGHTEWISHQPAPEFAPGSISFNPALSGDGRYVAFKTAMTVRTEPTAYRWDRKDGVLRHVADGVGMDLAGEPDGKGPMLSADGGRICYLAGRQVYVWDAATGTPVLASVTTTGTTNTSEGCVSASMNRAGTHVVFVSSAADLGVEDTHGAAQAFVRDLSAGVTRTVSVGSSGVALKRDAACPVLSDDGTRIAYQTDDTTLVDGDDNASADVFVRDVPAGVTQLVSARDARLPRVTGNRRSQLDAVSADGLTVVFTSLAEDLVANDHNGAPDIFAANPMTGAVELISVSPVTGQSGNGGSQSSVISGTGVVVAFASTATDLSPLATTGHGDVYVCDLGNHQTTLASVDAVGTGGGDRPSSLAGISSSGRYVVFAGFSTDLVSATPPSTFGLFSRDLAMGLTTELGTGPFVTGNPLSYVFGEGAMVFLASSPSSRPLYYRAFDGTTNEAIGPFSNPRLQAVSGDGRWIAFSRPTGPAGAPVKPYTLEIYDRINATNQLVTSARDPVPAYDELARQRMFSGDGRSLVFSDTSSRLMEADTNGASDVFVADLDAGVLRLVSVNRTGTASANGSSDQGSFSADGRWVVFRSTATDLTDDPPGVGPQIYLRDLAAGKTILVSRASQGGGGNGGASRPLILADGKTVVFTSTADNLVAGDFNGARDLFVARVSGFGTVEPFRVDALREADGSVRLMWPYSNGSVYGIQFKPSWDDEWTTMASPITIEGAKGVARVSIAGSVQGLFRVVILP